MRPGSGRFGRRRRSRGSGEGGVPACWPDASSPVASARRVELHFLSRNELRGRKRCVMQRGQGLAEA